jgi:gas vesicle protein
MSKKTPFFLTGFFIGALASGAAVLLFAPRPGKETRAQIREKSVEWLERAEATYAEALKRLEAGTAEIHRKTEELSAKVDKALGRDEEELVRWQEELAAIEEASDEALAEARMG